MGQIAQQDKIIFTSTHSFNSPFTPEYWGGVNVAYKIRDYINVGMMGDVLFRTKEGNKISTASVLSWNATTNDYSLYICFPDGTI